MVRNGGKIWGSKWREDLGFEMAGRLGLRNGAREDLWCEMAGRFVVRKAGRFVVRNGGKIWGEKCAKKMLPSAACYQSTTTLNYPLSYHYAELPATRAKRVKKAESATDG